VNVPEPSEVVDGWLVDLERAGRELIEPVSGLDALDAMAAARSKPTVGFMERYTRVLAC
jgi:hypothetical protein